VGRQRAADRDAIDEQEDDFKAGVEWIWRTPCRPEAIPVSVLLATAGRRQTLLLAALLLEGEQIVSGVSHGRASAKAVRRLFLRSLHLPSRER
jgi:hypothetical protein